MRTLFVLLISFCAPTLFAQTVIDTVQYRFSYKAEIRKFAEDTDKGMDELTVDVGKRITHCYSRWEYGNKELMDSVFATDNSFENMNNVMQEKGFPGNSFRYDIFTNYPAKGRRTVEWHSYRMFVYQEDSDAPEWSLLAGDTVVCGYECHKAVGFYRGRQWNVWYTLDIPIQEGPWKLSGLPGLIMKAEDNKRDFSFECIGIKKVVNVRMRYSGSEKVGMSRSKIKEMQILEGSDHERFKEMMGISYKAYGANGKPVTKPVRTTVLIEF